MDGLYIGVNMKYKILDKLPRGSIYDGYSKSEPNAWVFIDAAGRLCITPLTGGTLVLEEAEFSHLSGELMVIQGEKD